MRFAVAGNGKMAVDVLRVLTATPGAEPVLCLGDPVHEMAQSRVAKICAEAAVRYLPVRSVNDPEARDALTAARPDYIVSANNFSIFKAPSLALAARGVKDAASRSPVWTAS